MEHPPKQGLKQCENKTEEEVPDGVLMEHPPKQGLKQYFLVDIQVFSCGFNGTSTKTRIETLRFHEPLFLDRRVLMEHPPKQGLKLSKPTSLRKSSSKF